MRSKKKSRLASAGAPSDPKQRKKAPPGKAKEASNEGFTLQWKPKKVSREDVTFIFRNLSTLVDNGVSLPKALGALADERGMESARDMLVSIRKTLETGASFSAALAAFPATFDKITVNQIRVGERAGALPECLANIATQREKAGKLRGEIIKKLAYPMMLMVVGSGVIAFLLAYVVPVFEETYASARVPLPGITQTLIVVGQIAQDYWMGILLLIAGTVIALKQVRKNERLSRQMDAQLLRLPLVGQWMRDIAVLELMEVLGDLMEAGFTLSDALAEASGSVSNQEVRSCVSELQMAVNRGERFSRHIEQHSELFPPLVSQLVIVGEQTGNLTNATRCIRTHLHEEIERRGDVFVGVIEPALTISLASAVAVILLAIYLPMFDMINTVG
ncbi:MAG: type II secretion system F family protein [Planctomycetota bacterium]